MTNYNIIEKLNLKIIPEIVSQFPYLVKLIQECYVEKKHIDRLLITKSKNRNAKHTLIKQKIPLIVYSAYMMCKSLGKLDILEDEVHNIIVRLYNYLDRKTGTSVPAYDITVSQLIHEQLEKDLLEQSEENVDEYANIISYDEDKCILDDCMPRLLMKR